MTKGKQALPEVSPDQWKAGDFLREARQEKGLSTGDIARETKIPVAGIQAIEQSDYERLPSDSFVRGFIILYGETVGADSRPLADRFLAERDAWRKTHSRCRKGLDCRNLSPKKLAEPAHISSAAIALILLALIALSLAAFCFYFSWNPMAFVIGHKKLPASAIEEVFHPADPSTRQAADQTSLNLDAYFLKSTGLVLALDNEQAIRQAYDQGSRAHWRAEKQIRLEFFQPDSAVLRLNGQDLPFPQAATSPYIINIQDRDPQDQ